MKEAGLDPALMYDPDARYPWRLMQKLWRLGVAATGDKCLGIRAARQLQPSALHGLGFSWLASDSLEDGLKRLLRYYRILSDAARLEARENGSSIEIAIGWDSPDAAAEAEDAAVDAVLGVFLGMCRLTLGEDISALRVHLQHEVPPCAEEFTEFFSGPIEFGAERNAFALDARILSRRLPTGNPTLARVNDQVVVEYLSNFDKNNLSARVRERLIDLLPTGTTSQEKIANDLHMNVRALQRRLSGEGTRYKYLLDEVRRELAIAYARENRFSINQIAYLVGFSEPTNFTRAFRRWTGLSPQAYRRRALKR
jgi:AraC-like DNA-binding protein